MQQNTTIVFFIFYIIIIICLWMGTKTNVWEQFYIPPASLLLFTSAYNVSNSLYLLYIGRTIWISLFASGDFLTYGSWM